MKRGGCIRLVEEEHHLLYLGPAETVNRFCSNEHAGWTNDFTQQHHVLSTNQEETMKVLSKSVFVIYSFDRIFKNEISWKQKGQKKKEVNVRKEEKKRIFF